MTRTFRYIIAVLLVVAALALRLTLDPILGANSPFLILSILLTARFAGVGPGLLATGLSVIAFWFFLIEPRYSFAIANVRDIWNLVVLAATGSAISMLAKETGDNSTHNVAGGRLTVPFVRRIGLLSGALILVAIFTDLLYSDFAQEKGRQHWVTHTYEVLNEAQLLTSTVEQAESAQRGFLLTGEEESLRVFQSDSKAEQAVCARLRQLTADNPRQLARTTQLERSANDTLSSLRDALWLRQKSGAGAVGTWLRRGEGRRLMDAFHETARAFEAEERELLAIRSRAAAEQALRTRWMLGLGSGSLLLLLIVAAAVIEWDIQQRDVARQSIRRSEERLRMALDAANAGTWEWNLSTGENVWSEELFKVYGLAPNSCRPSYDAWQKVVHPDDRAEAAMVVGAAARAGTELNVEFRVRDHDGGERWLLARAQPVKDARGRTECYIGIAMDITHRKKAEEALRERERNLRRFTEVAPVALAMFDRDMRYLAASQRFRDDYRVGAQDLIGRSHYEVFPEIPEAWREIHQRCLAGAVERNPGERFLRRDGGEQWIRWEIQPWREANGELGGIVLFSEDITAGTISEQARRESEERFRTLANAIPQLCWMADAAGWINWYNQRWYEYTGTSAEQMDGWGWQSVHDPEVLPRVLERWRSSLATGEPFEMVFPLRAADGSFHSFLTRVSPVRNEAGEVVRWFGTNTDISKQLVVEEELRQESENRRLAMEAAELGAWEYQLETGTVLRDERCASMFGLDSGEGYEKAVARVHPEDRAETGEAVKRALAGVNDGAFHREFRIVWPDGSVRWIASHGRAHLEQRRPVRFLGVNKDITQRKTSELEIRLLNTELERRVTQRTADLETANKELEAFSYSVSHDLRAPLRGIDGWSLALAEDYADQLDERALQFLGRVRSETQRMGLLIDDMLELSRIASYEIRVAAVDLTALARVVAGRLAEAHPNRRMEFVIEPGMTTGGDGRLLEIALANLLGNAVKFTGPRDVARIEFGEVAEGSEKVYCIRDNGVGFDMVYAGSLFGAFQRLHKSSEFPGTGIGLAIVQRVIHRHRGRVWADAKRDEGAAFFFTIGTIL